MSSLEIPHQNFTPRERGVAIPESQVEIIRKQFKEVITKTVTQDDRLSGCFVYGSGASLFSDNNRMSKGSDLDVIPVTKKFHTPAERQLIASEFAQNLHNNFKTAGIDIIIDYSSPRIKGETLSEILTYVEEELGYGYTTDFALILSPEVTNNEGKQLTETVITTLE